MGTKKICPAYEENEQPVKIEKLKDNPKFINEEIGCYKWWAKEDEFEKLMKKLNLTLEKNESLFETFDYENERYYCVYVGKADWGKRKKNNLRVRIMKKHIFGRVRVSTLRKTIACLMEYYENPEELVNKNFINRFMVQPIYLKKGEELNVREKYFINEPNNDGDSYFRILNYKENEHDLFRTITKEKIENTRRKAERINPSLFPPSRKKK
jgi:hypothetical protein